MVRGKSIHIGLNFVDPDAYNGWDGQLNGCVNDATGLKGVADSLGYDSIILLNSAATSLRVIQEIARAAQMLQTDDILLLTYSGHGGQVIDADGDEVDAKDETWVLYDREVIDDELYSLWSQFAPGVRIFVLSDSCHSGTVAKQTMAEDVEQVRKTRRRRGNKQAHMSKTRNSTQPQWEDKRKAMPLDIERQVNDRDREMYDTLQLIAGCRDRRHRLLRRKTTEPAATVGQIAASVLLISGCQDNQFSYDGNYYGQFTGTLLQVWNNGMFQGDYQKFHQDILDLMPPEQSPNYFTVGANYPAFEQQKPFTIQLASVGGGSTTPETPIDDTPTGGTSPTERPVLRRGDRGQAVIELQKLLQLNGYYLEADGIFGPRTESYVRAFQQSNGLVADGIVGSKTWSALQALVPTF